MHPSEMIQNLRLKYAFSSLLAYSGAVSNENKNEYITLVEINTF